MPRVHNKRHAGIPEDAVYVGRPTKWGNPFSHQDGTLARYKVRTRDESVQAYEDYILRLIKEDPCFLETITKELKGKDLVCWCYPQKCHADVLLKIANDI